MSGVTRAGPGPLIFDLAGTTLDAEERELLAHPFAGGAILFSRNYASFEQLAELTRQIRALRDPPLLIATDQEGGRVQCFRAGFTALPPCRALGRYYDAEPGPAAALATDVGWLMAAELKAAGVDMSFAPVLDLARGNPAIGDRAFHGEPHSVALLATAYTRGMREAGMAATGKHFPGHGSVQTDSHRERCVDERAWDALASCDLVPFVRLVEAGIGALMTAHVVYPRIDALPASASPEWIERILRQRLGYDGLIVSDDLGMAAAGLGDAPTRVCAALTAGNDMVLLCNDRRGVIQTLDRCTSRGPPERRLAPLHGAAQVELRGVRSHPRWTRTQKALDRLSDPSLFQLDKTPENYASPIRPDQLTRRHNDG